MSVTLPQAFEKAMRELLGEEFPAYQAALEEPAFRGLRRNPLKCRQGELEPLLPFPWKETPFSPLSSYAPADWKPGALPAHHAGLFYVQEPSACSAVTALDPQPGDRVLDL
ncbi:MAG TPA: hypothetical protein H9838_07735, partial [Candidatus Acutalibacter pullistercoris]|nr:hypothetical protein [Candidatus Acutalibacter pullistercoris]